MRRNILLSLHLIQGLGGKVKYDRNIPEIDHIFPKSTLFEQKFSEAEVNHIGNFWILAQNKNRNKTDKHPKAYFLENSQPAENVSLSEMQKALIDSKMLDFKMYRKFTRERGVLMLSAIKKRVGLADSDFNVLQKTDTE